MTAHAVFITHHTKAGQRADAERFWNRIMKPAIQANPDHLAYVYTLPDDEADVIRAFQLYRTSTHAEAFVRTPAYQRYSEAVAPHLDGPPDVVSTPAAWVKE